MALPDEVPRTPQWTVGERMSKARRVAGYSQAQMAALFEVSEATISSWETEARRPHNLLEVLKRWAEICNVPFAWLVTGSEAIVTKGDDVYNPLVAVEDERQGRFKLDPFPPSRIDPELSLVV